MQIINQKETDVKDWSSNIIANDASLASDLINLKPHLHLSGHQNIPQSFLSCKLCEAASLSTIDYSFQSLNSCRDLAEVGGTSSTSALWPNVAKVGFKSQQCLPVAG